MEDSDGQSHLGLEDHGVPLMTESQGCGCGRSGPIVHVLILLSLKNHY